MENQVIHTRIDRLRAWMQAEGLHAFIFPSTDPHKSEYTPDHWKTREWISGFDGSAGTAVISLTEAALWTDSRYFLSAEAQLAGTDIQLMKIGLPETPTLTAWLGQQLSSGSRVGVEDWVVSKTYFETLQTELGMHGIALCGGGDPATALWEERPILPLAPIEIHPLTYAGTPCHEKLSSLRQHMREQHGDTLLVTQLDEIAWLFNLRGQDVHCNPVFVAYALVGQEDCTLYTDLRKVTPEVEAYLHEEAVQVKPYEEIATALGALDNKRLILDESTVNYHLYTCLPKTIQLVNNLPYLSLCKAVKNPIELRGFRKAMCRDGVAMVKFLRWLKPAVKQGGVTEMDVDRKLTELRSQQDLYRGISFDTIAGYGAHGAIVHYEATPETNITLQPRGLLLLDSGAQYQDGTTDITRTIALGPLTEEERHDYTLVLRGHIRLGMVKFPRHTTGTQLDICARYAMWQEGINYLHGTGHGVGSYLNVHEGPHQIRMNHMPAPLVAGMTVTNEPGIYKAGKHGCRIENTMLILPYKRGEFGEFLQLVPLTLCPIDTAPIKVDEMQDDELAYLNQYHQYVYKTLLPLLDDEADRAWLREHTRPLVKQQHKEEAADTKPQDITNNTKKKKGIWRLLRG